MKGGFWKDEVLLKSFNTSLGRSIISSIPLSIFGIYDSNINGMSVKENLYGGKIKWCKIYRNNTLLRDFIPVRVSQIGYMYDKVSGELFGNAGTGNFIIGNDINT